MKNLDLKEAADAIEEIGSDLHKIEEDLTGKDLAAATHQTINRLKEQIAVLEAVGYKAVRS